MLRKIALALLALAVVIQLVPYGRGHSNPPVTGEPVWNGPETRATFQRVCANCHSNETTWPWYSHIAPVSWLVQHDVDEGRAEFNVSHADVGKDADDAAKMVLKNRMPPKIYLVGHPEARLTDDERRAFAVGLDATFGEGRAHGGDETESMREKAGYLDP
ncbi:MAG TPA: heme-binding domain-containing protein [Candidatus Krumholzibacteria bacterium]|nr:heme-binding domain-containing protein [Candidatus Krumholzibacteria bacterium]